jgi:anti-anti-sigma factor
MLAGWGAMENKRDLDIESAGDVAIASFQSACISDVEEITSASVRLNEYIETHHPGGLVFDFAGVKFFSSQVLGLLLQTRARIETYAGQVAVSSLSPQLERVFRITNLDKLFTLYPDRTAALKRFSGLPK